MARPRTRAVLIWLSAWVVLAAASTLLHRAAWLWPPDSPPPTPVQHANNVSHMVTVPGWIAVRYIGRGWRTGGWGYPALASGTAWAFWLSGLWLVLLGRRAMIQWRKGEHRLPFGTTVQIPGAPVVLGQPESSRRRFLATAPVALAGAGLAGGLVRATMVDPWDLRTVRYTLPIRDLPAQLDGLRIVQISDTHLGPRIPAQFIRETVQRAIELRPDLVMLTGDYIHAGVDHIDTAVELFRPLLNLDVPVVGVLGNHDWYGDGRRIYRSLERAGVCMIDNRRIYLDAHNRMLTERPPASGVTVAGLADLIEDTIDPDAALRAAPSELPVLLLSHNPDAAEIRYFQSRRLRPPRVDVMISGHTHGGQVHIPLLGTPAIPSRYGQKYAGGLVKGPAFPVLVSRGVGMSILPVRFGVPPEISEMTLRAARSG